MKTLHCVLVVLFSSIMMLPAGPVCSEETGPGVSPQISDVENAAPAYARWSLPEGATVRLGKGYINALQFAPDGNRFVVAASIGIWVYDAHTGEEIALYTGHSRPVTALAFSPDGVVLASGDESGEVRLWRAGTGELLSVLQPGRGDNKVMALVFTEDGTKLIGAGLWEILVWELGTEVSQPIVTRLEGLQGSRSYNDATVFSPDGRFLASAVMPDSSKNRPSTLYVWDVDTANLLTLQLHSDLESYPKAGHWITSLAFSPDSTTLASGDTSEMIQFWDLGTGKPRPTSRLVSFGSDALTFSPNSEFFAASGHRYGIVQVWGIPDEKQYQGWHRIGQYLPKLTLEEHKEETFQLAFSPDGKMLITASHDGTVKGWSTTSGRQRFTCPEHSRAGWVAFSETGNVRVNRSSGPVIHQQQWNVATGVQFATRFLDTSPQFMDPWQIYHSAQSPDGTTFALYYGVDGAWHLWDSHTKRSWALLVGQPKGERPHELRSAFAPNGKMLASRGGDNLIRLWAIPNRPQSLSEHSLSSARQKIDPHFTFEGSTEYIWALGFSSDGKTLAIGSEDATVRLWDVESGDALFTLIGHDRATHGYIRAFRTFAFSPDGKTLAGASREQLCLWDLVTGKQLRAIPQQGANGIITLTFSPDGRTLLSGNWEGEIQLREPRTAVPIVTHRAHIKWIYELLFSPDGKTLASAGSDGTVLLWDWEKISRLEDR